jgi:ArsR family transcriptional regulator
MKVSDLNAAVAAARAIGHRARLRTLAMLRSGELCVCQITEVLQLASSTVSIHLKELKRAGLVSERKDGRWVFIALSDGPDARPWIETVLGVIEDDPQIESDERKVQELRLLAVEDLCRLGFEGAKARQAGNVGQDVTPVQKAGRKTGR